MYVLSLQYCSQHLLAGKGGYRPYLLFHWWGYSTFTPPFPKCVQSRSRLWSFRIYVILATRVRMLRHLDPKTHRPRNPPSENLNGVLSAMPVGGIRDVRFPGLRTAVYGRNIRAWIWDLSKTLRNHRASLSSYLFVTGSGKPGPLQTLRFTTFGSAE